MADKKEEKKAVKPTAKLKKQEYPVKNEFDVGDKTYKKGEKISLTKEGYKYLHTKNKV